MGYAVRPLTRHRPARKSRSPRFRLNWAPNGGSLQYVITGDGTMLLSQDAVVVALVSTNTGGGLRSIRYTSPVRAM